METSTSQAVQLGTNLRFLNRISKSKFKMLVGLCPNPLCSASGGCRLRIFAKCFFDLSADACGIGTFCTDGFPEAENSAM